MQKKRRIKKGIYSNSSIVASKKVTVLFFSTKYYFIPYKTAKFMGKASIIDHLVLLYGISACQTVLLKNAVLIRCRGPPSEILKLFQFQIRRVEMAEKEYFLYIEGKRIEVTEEVYREYYRGESAGSAILWKI